MLRAGRYEAEHWFAGSRYRYCSLIVCMVCDRKEENWAIITYKASHPYQIQSPSAQVHRQYQVDQEAQSGVLKMPSW